MCQWHGFSHPLGFILPQRKQIPQPRWIPHPGIWRRLCTKLQWPCPYHFKNNWKCHIFSIRSWSWRSSSKRGFLRKPTLANPLFILLVKITRNTPSWKISDTQLPKIPAKPTQCTSLHETSGKHMMALSWSMNQNLGIEGLVSEVLVVWMGQTSKHIEIIILPGVTYNDKPVTKSMVGINNQNLSLNDIGIGL